MSIGDTRKIRFDITVGSKWVIGEKLPVGGDNRQVDLEFEQRTEDPMSEAESELSSAMSEEYHVWYWTWLD